MDKLCKDCKHCKPYRYIPFIPFWKNYELAQCVAPKAFLKIEKVTGKKVRYYDYCSSQRVADFDDGRACGESAKWFEARNA